MATLYKITDQDGWTRRRHTNACLWGPGVTHTGTGEGGLCGPGYIHAYADPLVAVFLNPLHGAYADGFRLWEAEGEIAIDDNGLKCGCVSLTTVREIPIPVVTIGQRVRFAILCAKQVTEDKKWLTWADAWLNNEDRTAAWAAQAAAEWVAQAAAAWAAEVTPIDLPAIARKAVEHQMTRASK